ncbi:hypothetical protein QUB56_11150 [Microcoleus sp. AR_TQ3_B6]|uniref:hypothetical protein n=1 Tax=Microcoleus sp. AR_TQ3_B6 TaxID=3055284 RepID=UPI002FD2B6A3
MGDEFLGTGDDFWGRETALPCPEGAVLSMVASDWIIRAIGRLGNVRSGARAIGRSGNVRSGDRAIGKCALCGQIHHAIRLILPVTRN